MQEVTARLDRLIELFEQQNNLLRTFVEAMVREEEDVVPLQQLKDLLDQQRGGAPNLSTMDREEEPQGDEQRGG